MHPERGFRLYPFTVRYQDLPSIESKFLRRIAKVLNFIAREYCAKRFKRMLPRISHRANTIKFKNRRHPKLCFLRHLALR